MAQRDQYYVNGFMRRDSYRMPSSPPPPQIHREEVQREEDDRKFNYNELIAVVSSEESDLEQDVCNGSMQPNGDFNAEITKQEVLPSISNTQPVIQSVRTVNIEALSHNVQEKTQDRRPNDHRSIENHANSHHANENRPNDSHSNDQQQKGHQSNDRQASEKPASNVQPSANLPYEELLKTVSSLAETVKSLQNNIENFENARNSKRKHKKRSRRHYSSDSTSSDTGSSSSGSSERRRKRRRHRHKSSRSRRRRYSVSSSDSDSDRQSRKYHRHCYHCCKYDDKMAKPSHNSVPQISTPIQKSNLSMAETSTRRNVYSNNENDLQTPSNEPSTSFQNGLQMKRRNSIRQSRSERKIIESDDSDESESENSSLSSKQKRKRTSKPTPTVTFKRRDSVAANSVATQEIFRPPNSNKNLYFTSRHANTCQICKKSFAHHIVAHYRRCHENSEVYVSRISSKMASTADNGHHSAKKTPSGKLKAICFFCEEKKEFVPNYWFDHYRSHTGEYGSKCDVCKTLYSGSYKNCCKRPLTKIFDEDLYTSDFVAFMCEICRFVQIDEATVRKHLRNEHEDAADDQYHEITLLPSLRKINKRMA